MVADGIGVKAAIDLSRSIQQGLSQVGLRSRRLGHWVDHSMKMLCQPIDGRLEVQALQMDHQVNGAPAHAAVPVYELGAVD